jgi:hypothetical protein
VQSKRRPHGRTTKPISLPSTRTWFDLGKCVSLKRPFSETLAWNFQTWIRVAVEKASSSSPTLQGRCAPRTAQCPLRSESDRIAVSPRNDAKGAISQHRPSKVQHTVSLPPEMSGAYYGGNAQGKQHVEE